MSSAAESVQGLAPRWGIRRWERWLVDRWELGWGSSRPEAWELEQRIRALQDELARLDAELAMQREGLRRLAREQWLEP